MVLKKNNNKEFFSIHLVELRNRTIYFFLFFLFSFFFTYYFVEDIFSFFVHPFIESIDFKDNKRLIYTGLAEAFLSYLKLSLVSAFIISSPFLVYQLWKFVAPGLYKNEKKALLPYLIATPILFLLGGMLIYYLVNFIA